MFGGAPSDQAAINHGTYFYWVRLSLDIFLLDHLLTDCYRPVRKGLSGTGAQLQVSLFFSSHTSCYPDLLSELLILV